MDPVDAVLSPHHQRHDAAPAAERASGRTAAGSTSLLVRSLGGSNSLGGSQGRPCCLLGDEDYISRDMPTSRLSQPPKFESAMKAALAAQRPVARVPALGMAGSAVAVDKLPAYSCDVHIEGVFMRKMEIEDTIKRAELRSWQMVYVVLHGTALNFYHAKKDRWWASSKPQEPSISPDNPPYISRGKLKKGYSLMHADAGIAADYRKRRYVIRMRAETDQFLFSCVELSTFVTWLDRLFAAINVAGPIDDREFPRDQSIPRIQRMRWFRGQVPRPFDGLQPLDDHTQRNAAEPGRDAGNDENEDGASTAGSATEPPPRPINTTNNHDNNQTLQQSPPHTSLPLQNAFTAPQPVAITTQCLITATYPHESLDPDTGKWRPRQKWTAMHDQLYAKLCFAVLLFKSPRKSNYVVSRNEQWFVDWTTGRKVRVLPPAYGELDDITTSARPWQGVMPESMLI